jgi:hypothetical protein
MRPSFRLLIAATVFVAAPLVASAQTRATWSLQASGLLTGLGGDAYSGIEPGLGFEAQIRRKLTPVWSLGCGVQDTFHSYSDFAGDVNLIGVFCEPRALVDIQSDRIFPYISARGSVLRQSVKDPLGFSGNANGITANVGAGIMIPFGDGASNYPKVLEFGGSAGYTTFGDFSGSGGAGSSFTKSTGSGWNFVLRIGLAVGIAGGGSR